MTRRLRAATLTLALLAAWLALPVSAAHAVSCGSPTHLTFDNAHTATTDGYGSGGSTVQADTNNFTNMDVWSPDVRLPASATPTTVQTMDICSNTDWSATITETTNAAPNYPRVFTYPDSEYRFTHYDGTCNYEHAWSYFSHLSGTWAINAPAAGDWDESWDLWLGSFGGCVQTGVPQIELMTYTKWQGSIFAPTAMANFTTADGLNYDAYWSFSDYVADPNPGCKTAAGCLYLQTRMTTQAGSGTTHFGQLIQKLYAGGYTYFDPALGTNRPVMPNTADLADAQYGPEAVSQNATVAAGPITFAVSGFSFTAN